MVHVMHSTVQRKNSYLGWVCFSVRLNFSTFCRKNFRDDLSTGVRAFDWMEIIIRKFKLAEDRTRSPDIAERGVPLTYWFLEQAQQEEISSSPKVGKDEFCAHLTQTCWKGYLKGWERKGKGISARVTPRNYLKGGDQENLWKRRSRKHLKEEIKRFSSMPDLTSCQAVRSVFCWHWKASGAANFWQKSQSCANCKRAKTSSCQNKREMKKMTFTFDWVFSKELIYQDGMNCMVQYLWTG